MNNKNITIAGKSLYWRDWHAAGILRIKDLLDESGNFLSYDMLRRKTGLNTPFTNLWRLIAAIPSKWKHALESAKVTNNNKDKQIMYTARELTCKRARNVLTQRKFKEPLASSRLRRLGVDETTINAIYKLPFQITRETKLSIFQYKIIHNILPYGNLLHKMKISEIPRCKSCNEIESLPHLLVNCPNIRDFWNSVLLWWNNQNNENYSFDELGIMYGYNPEIFSSHVFNYFILLAKRHVFL